MKKGVILGNRYFPTNLGGGKEQWK